VRPTATNIYITVEINETINTLNTVVDDIKNAIINDFNGNDINSGNARRGCGDTIYASSLSVAVVKTAGVSDLVSITIGRSASPTGNFVTMNADEEPIVSADTIDVVINPMA
jgi:ribosomal protein S5